VVDGISLAYILCSTQFTQHTLLRVEREIIIIVIFLTPILNSQGMKKIRYAIQKTTKISEERIIIIIFYFFLFYTPGSIDPRG